MFISQALAATEEATHDGGGAFPPFDPTYFASQILWLAITFGLFYVIMSRVVIPRLAGILEVRKDRISRDLDETQRLKAEADAAHAAYEHELAEAKSNAHSIGLEATEKAKNEAAEARQKVEAELAEKMAEAEAHIAGIKKKALGEVGTIAADTTGEIVKQLIGGKLTKAEITKAVSAAGK
ncbi:MAG: F0F1 ATP synthase subunit B [Rhizobiaceae bacterium]